MNKILLFFFLTFIMTVNSTGQTFNANDLADKIIDAFQKRSFETYNKLMIDSVDFKEFLNDLRENSRMPKEQLDRFAQGEKLFPGSAILQFQKDFDRLLSKGIKIGIDWSQVKKAKFVFIEDTPEHSEKKHLSGHLNFTCKDTTYVLFGIEAMKLSSGYKILSIQMVFKGDINHYVDRDLLDEEDL